MPSLYEVRVVVVLVEFVSEYSEETKHSVENPNEVKLAADYYEAINPSSLSGQL